MMLFLFHLFLHEYSSYAPPTMNNYINKLLRVYKEQRNYLSGQISLSRVDPGHAALTRSALFVKV